MQRSSLKFNGALIALYAVVFLPIPVFADVGPGLMGYWKLDEAASGCTGYVREDATSTNDLTDNNTTCSNSGIIEKGADFELGNVEWLSITDAAQTGLDITGDITINAWVKLEAEVGAGSSYGIACKMGSYPANRSYCFLLSESAGEKLGSYIGDGSTQEYDSVAWSRDSGVWYMLTMTADPGNQVCYYVNGVLQGACQTLTVSSIVNGNGVFGIGSTAYSGTGEFDGVIDEVGVWNRVLTTDEITDLYNSGSAWAYPFTVESPDDGMATTSITIGEIYSVFTLGSFGTIFFIAFIMTIFLNIGKATMNLVRP